MCDWLVARYPTKYVREADSSGVFLPELDGWATGPLERIKGIEALKTCAKLVQEDLCLVKEETLEEAWDAVDESFAFGDDDDDDDDESRKLATRHTFRAGVVCFSFDPRKRHGKTLAGLHRPVPGYEEKMRHAVSRVFSGLTPEKAAVARQLGFAEQRTDCLHGARVAPEQRENRRRRSTSALREGSEGVVEESVVDVRRVRRYTT
jgi:hypothetical protein